MTAHVQALSAQRRGRARGAGFGTGLKPALSEVIESPSAIRRLSAPCLQWADKTSAGRLSFRLSLQIPRPNSSLVAPNSQFADSLTALHAGSRFKSYDRHNSSPHGGLFFRRKIPQLASHWRNMNATWNPKNRRHVLAICFARCLALLLVIVVAVVGGRVAARAAEHGVPEHPNVVIIFCDDVGYADIGPFGAKGYSTPNLDRMAAEGIRFTRFYSAQPVCSASRTALLTGCYPNRLGIQGALGPQAKIGINADEMTLAELVKQQGYATAIFGKWHLGHQPQFLPTHHGFDEYFGLPYSNDMWPLHPDYLTTDGDEETPRVSRSCR